MTVWSCWFTGEGIHNLFQGYFGGFEYYLTWSFLKLHLGSDLWASKILFVIEVVHFLQ